MFDINWSAFTAKNASPTKEFETLCTLLFCREFGIKPHTIKENFNQAGLEMEPHQIDGKWYGFQAKFISGDNDSFYRQAYESIMKAVQLHPEELDIIYVYTNKDIQGNPSDKDIQKNIGKPATERSPRMNLYFLEKDYGIKIKYFTKKNFEVALSQPQNQNLYNHYFSQTHTDTKQIQNPTAFIQQHDKNTTVAPLDTAFLFREQEIADLQGACETHKIVILKGASGVGKTKLALEVAQRSGQPVLCIANNGMPIQENLMDFIPEGSDYFIIIDDANQFSNIRMILEYLTVRTDCQVLLTVREYACHSITLEAENLWKCTTHALTAFTDAQIKELLRTIFDIQHPYFLEQICAIAKGNSRLAILAGRYASNEGTWDSISDATQFYDAYYGKFIGSTGVFADITMLKTLLAIAIYDATNLLREENISDLLDLLRLPIQDFTESCRKLHDLELVDIYYDDYIKISDQALRNFIFKHTLCDKKIVAIADLISVLFPHQCERLIYAINTIMQVFRNEEIREYTKGQVHIAWDIAEQQDSAHYLNFLLSFGTLEPDRSLSYLYQQITTQVATPYADEDIKIDFDHVMVNDIKLKILGELVKTDQYSTTIELLFLYYERQPHLCNEVYHTIIRNLGISPDTPYQNYELQLALLSHMEKCANNWTNPAIAMLYFHIIDKFLKIKQISYKNHTTEINIITFIATTAPEYLILRKKIWEQLLSIASTRQYARKIYGILQGYHLADDVAERLQDVFRLDFPYVLQIANVAFAAQELYKFTVYQRLEYRCAQYKIFCVHISALDSVRYDVYRLLAMDYQLFYMENKTAEGFQSVQDDLYSDFVAWADSAQITILLHMASRIYVQENMQHTVQENFKRILKKFKPTPYYHQIATYSLRETFHPQLMPHDIVQTLLAHDDKDAVFKLLWGASADRRDFLLWTYFCTLDADAITSDDLINLYEYLENLSDTPVRVFPYGDAKQLRKYNILDENAFLNCMRLIYMRKKHAPKLVYTYYRQVLYLLPDCIFLFEGNYELLVKIYLFQNKENPSFAYNSRIYQAICKVYPCVSQALLDFLLQEFVQQKSSKNSCLASCLWLGDTYIQDVNNYIEGILGVGDKYYLSIESTIENLLEQASVDVDSSRKINWVTQYIRTHATDVANRKHTLQAIMNASDDTCRLHWVMLFLEQNKSIADFRKLGIRKTSACWTVGDSSYWDREIAFCDALLKKLDGIAYIEHRHYVQAVREGITCEKKQDMLNYERDR